MGWFSKGRSDAGWLAVSLHDEGVCAAQIRYSADQKPEVTAALMQEASTGAEVSEALQKLGKSWNARRYKCTTLLAPHQYQFLPVEAPNVPGDELRTAIKWRLKEMLEFPVDDAAVDVIDVPQAKKSIGIERAVYAVAAPSNAIRERQQLFTDAEIPLSVIDIPEMAQRNVATLLEKGNRAIALISFNNDGGLLTISQGGELYVARRSDINLAQINSPEQERRQQAYDKLVRELERSLAHFGRQHSSVALEKLVIAPIGDRAPEMRDYLQGNVEIPVELLDLRSVLSLEAVPDVLPLERQARYLLTIGAALRVEEKAL